MILVMPFALLIGEAWGIGTDIVMRLAFGWPLYLARVLPRVHASSAGLAMGIVCLILALIGLHWFLRWFYREMPRKEEDAPRPVRSWSFRWTTALVSIFVLMFVTGIAAAVIIHQVVWLARARQPIFTTRLSTSPEFVRKQESVRNLRQIDMGTREYLEEAAHAESDGLVWIGPMEDARRQRRHSWMTMILPYVWAYRASPIHYDLPWNAPENSAYFRGVVREYLHPSIGIIRDPRGHALSHYAGNVNLLGKGRTFTYEDLKNGGSNTILAGEVATRFKPWGDPTNLRDPGLGVNVVPDGFGGPSGDGANFLFTDGSVRFLSKSTDPAVLRRLSMPTRPANP